MERAHQYTSILTSIGGSVCNFDTNFEPCSHCRFPCHNQETKSIQACLCVKPIKPSSYFCHIPTHTKHKSINQTSPCSTTTIVRYVRYRNDLTTLSAFALILWKRYVGGTSCLSASPCHSLGTYYKMTASDQRRSSPFGPFTW